MRIERDAQHDVLYIELREGEAEHTVDLDDGVHMDLDDEGRVLGVEFLSLGAFERYLERHDGQLYIPDRVQGQDVPRLRTYRPAAHDQRLLVEVALASLDPAQQEILRLHFYDGLGLEEIAEHLDVPIATVYQKIRIALGQLKTALEQLRTNLSNLRKEAPTLEDERPLEAALREL